LLAAIKAAGFTRESLQSLSAEDALMQLRANPAIELALNDYLAIAGFMLIGGYCISEKTLRESPNIIVARLLDALTVREDIGFDDELEQRVRSRIAPEDQEEFDQALADARKVNRLRDERGIYNDIWAFRALWECRWRWLFDLKKFASPKSIPALTTTCFMGWSKKLPTLVRTTPMWSKLPTDSVSR